ncbi:MAG TPA: cytochrome c4 [Rhodospirillaceae bacterium]|nr:cytochrome c4 [Rhodospirillaceae bacterium]
MKTKFLGIAIIVSSAIFGLPALAADAESCAACHGKDGASTDAKVPIIGGMSAEYLKGAMAAYKAKERPCPEATYADGPKKGTKSDMCKIAGETSDADTAAISTALAGKKFVRAAGQKVDAALAAKGKDIHDKQCDKCHTEGGSVAGDDSGVLAGQYLGYLSAELKDFKDGKRPMPKKMQPKMEAVPAADLDALAHYYASFK